MNLKEIANHFLDWTKKKIRHHVDESKNKLYFRKREVWWTALGKNIGFEMNGKHEYFSRPVLIIKKYSKDMCFVLPLTTQIKPDSPSYQYKFYLNKKLNAVNLSQGRTISSKRLMQKEGAVDEKLFEDIIEKFVIFLKK